MQVHDELILDTPPEEKERCQGHRLRTACRTPSGLTFRLSRKVRSGHSWYDTKIEMPPKRENRRRNGCALVSRAGNRRGEDLRYPPASRARCYGAGCDILPRFRRWSPVRKAFALLVRRYGEGLLQQNGELDRRALAKKIFSNWRMSVWQSTRSCIRSYSSACWSRKVSFGIWERSVARIL